MTYFLLFFLQSLAHHLFTMVTMARLWHPPGWWSNKRLQVSPRLWSHLLTSISPTTYTRIHMDSKPFLLPISPLYGGHSNPISSTCLWTYGHTHSQNNHDIKETWDKLIENINYCAKMMLHIFDGMDYWVNAIWNVLNLYFFLLMSTFHWWWD